MHGWAPEVMEAVGVPRPTPAGYLEVFFDASDASRKAGQDALGRMQSRIDDRDAPTTWATRQAQYNAACAWGTPDHRNSNASRPSTRRSSSIYPDAAHGFLFRHHTEFGADVDVFLQRES